MSKIVRVKTPPLVFKHRLVYSINNPNWTENEIVEWAKRTCVGDVWFQPIMYMSGFKHYLGHDITLWFAKEQDAMLFKLEFII